MEQIFTVTHGTSGHYKAFWCYFAGVTELKRERWICQLLLLSQSSYTLFKQLIDQDFVWYFAYRCFYSVSAYLFMQKLIVSEHNIYCTEKKNGLMHFIKKGQKLKSASSIISSVEHLCKCTAPKILLFVLLCYLSASSTAMVLYAWSLKWES